MDIFSSRNMMSVILIATYFPVKYVLSDMVLFRGNAESLHKKIRNYSFFQIQYLEDILHTSRPVIASVYPVYHVLSCISDSGHYFLYLMKISCISCISENCNPKIKNQPNFSHFTHQGMIKPI